MNDTEFQKRPSINDEQLIAAAMNYLKYHDPNAATREDAISLLAYMQTFARSAATTVSEESFDKYYEAYKAQRDKK